MARTKILATMGPSIDSVAIIEELIDTGVNAFRINFSHANATVHSKSIDKIRQAAKNKGVHIGVLADLQGPKIRVGKFINGSVTLKEGSNFEFSTTLANDQGNQDCVAVEYEDLIKDCQVGNTLLLDDGLIQLEVTDKSATSLFCRVIMGGELKNNKGINLKGGGLSADALTEKDIADIADIAKLDVDFVAISFVRTAQCVRNAKKILKQHNCNPLIVSKIERVEAVEDKNLSEIIDESDLIMIARGDLAVEIGDAELLGIQKSIVRLCLRKNRIVIVATQMMESMIENPMPTRAEVMDVANAVIDGTDAVMLSAESAVGQYPVKTVEAMHRVIEGAEKTSLAIEHQGFLDNTVKNTDEVIALSAMHAVNHLERVSAVICMTSSGNTPKLLSRFNSNFPIYAFSRVIKSLRSMSLTRNVYPYDGSQLPKNDRQSFNDVINVLKQEGKIKKNDYVIFTFGEVVGKIGGTNSILINQVE